MPHHYLFVFLGALLFDIVPFPFLPAFTIMIFLQVRYGLDLRAVLLIGVAGSVLGRYILSRYIPYFSDRYFKPTKNADLHFLGKKLKAKGWQSQVAIFTYSLLPLPTTPLFVAGGMAKLKPLYLIPAFFLGKLTSDSIALTMGKHAAENISSIRAGLFSWQSITGLTGSLLLFGALLFIDWRSLLHQGRWVVRFNIFR